MEESPPWTGEDLLEMAKIYDQQADELQNEAVKFGLAKKPHMVPKRFFRTGFMHIAASRWKAARDLRELADMHRSEGKRLLALENGGDHRKKNSGRKQRSKLIRRQSSQTDHRKGGPGGHVKAGWNGYG